MTPVLASRPDPLLCFLVFYFLFSTHSIKASVLTILMRWPLTKLSTLSSMPNPLVRFVFWIYSTCQQHLPVDPDEELYLLLVSMISLINLLSHWLSSLLLALLPLARICMFDPGLCPEGHHTLLYRLCPAHFQMTILMKSAWQLFHRKAWYSRLYNLKSNSLSSPM